MFLVGDRHLAVQIVACPSRAVSSHRDVGWIVMRRIRVIIIRSIARVVAEGWRLFVVGPYHAGGCTDDRRVSLQGARL